MRVSTLKHSVLVSFAALVFAFSSPAMAAVSDDWKAGKEAFQRGDFVSALVYFETARDRGMDGPAVHYNIAVSQYKLGRYESARASFELIAHRFPKMRALAEYNLGLTATRLGDGNGAQAHFRKAYELSSDDRKLRALASRQLRTVEPEARTAARWSGAVGVRGGYDDNVALLDETVLPAGTTTDSPVAQVFASIGGPWSRKDGLRFDGSAYLVKYVDADDFDQTQLSGGVYYEWRPRDWRLHLGVQASVSSVGGDAYDRKMGPRARAVRYLNPNSSIDLRYRYDDVAEADSVFAGIAGSRQVFDARYRWYRDAHRLQLRFSLETNDRRDAGVSPDRNRFRIDYRYQPEHGLGFETGFALRNSEYDAIATPREEDLTTLRGAITYTFERDWIALIEYRDASNDSSDPAFAYDRGVLTLGAVKSF